MEVPDGSSVGSDAQGEMLPPYSVWHYVVELGCQLVSRCFRLMRSDGDEPQVRNKAGVVRDTAVCAWLKRWKQWGFKCAAFLRLMNPTSDMPFVKCYEERRYVERLANYIGEFGDSDAAPPVFLALFFSSPIRTIGSGSSTE